MRGKAKSRIALVLAAALALGAVGVLSSMAWLTERASNLDPDPSGVEAIGAEDEAAGENDGSGGRRLGLLAGRQPGHHRMGHRAGRRHRLPDRPGP